MKTLLALLCMSAGTAVLAAPCDSSVRAQVLAPATLAGDSVLLNCSLTLSATDVVTRRLLLAGASASGTVLDCQGALLDGRGVNAGGDMLVVQSVKTPTGWSRPENVTVTNCRVQGSVRLIGMGVNGEAPEVRASSRLDAFHTQRLQDAAPRAVVLDRLQIVGQGRNPVYFAPGVTYSVLQDSTIAGRSDGSALYLDAESAFNIVRRNSFSTKTATRELVAIDGSADNRLYSNTFSALTNGGIYLYRNCGEGGTVRHQAPERNQILGNGFYYNKYTGSNPSVWLAARNGNRLYCSDDLGFPWGSSVNDRDLARYNAVGENQIVKLEPTTMIRVDEMPNTLLANRKVAALALGAAPCYLSTTAQLLASGQQALVREATGCVQYSCNAGELSGVPGTCGDEVIVNFGCQVTGKNAGCSSRVNCPTGLRALAVRAACDLETGTTNLTNVGWGQGVVTRASDKVSDGLCTVAGRQWSSGTVALTPTGTFVNYSCREYDSNGGDCEVRGQLRCGP